MHNLETNEVTIAHNFKEEPGWQHSESMFSVHQLYSLTRIHKNIPEARQYNS
jgi:hypothetical protein